MSSDLGDVDLAGPTGLAVKVVVALVVGVCNEVGCVSFAVGVLVTALRLDDCPPFPAFDDDGLEVIGATVVVDVAVAVVFVTAVVVVTVVVVADDAFLVCDDSATLALCGNRLHSLSLYTILSIVTRLPSGGL